MWQGIADKDQLGTRLCTNKIKPWFKFSKLLFYDSMNVQLSVNEGNVFNRFYLSFCLSVKGGSPCNHYFGQS